MARLSVHSWWILSVCHFLLFVPSLIVISETFNLLISGYRKSKPTNYVSFPPWTVVSWSSRRTLRLCYESMDVFTVVYSASKMASTIQDQPRLHAALADCSICLVP